MTEEKWKTEEDGVIKVRTCAWSAPGDHPTGCGIILHVKDGKLVKVEGDPEHPISQGRLCPRCLAFDEAEYHPDRLLHPMKRDPKDRGKDCWEQITWDEAYDLAEKEIRRVWEEYGQESCFVVTGTGRETTMWANVYATNVLGSPNRTGCISGASCYGPRCSIANYHLGAGYPELDYAAFFPDRYDDPRYEVPKYILIWGKNPIYSNSDGLFGHAVVDLMQRGSKLIVIDPRVTWLAAHAEYHLQLRPGTDAAVGMGFANVIIQEDIYDHEFVEKWCYGFKKFAECVSEWTPERVEEVAWVPAEVLRGAARAFATNAPSSAMWGLAFDMQENGIQAGHLFIAICAICGYLDVPGGITLAAPASFMGKWRYDAINSLPQAARDKIVKPEDDSMYQAFYKAGSMPGALGDTIIDWLEYENPPFPLKLGWIVGSNFLACSAAQPKRWLEDFKKVEFMIANEMFMTPTCMALVDLILPISTWAEHEGVVLPQFGRNTHFLGAMNPALDPGDTKSDLIIMMEMGKRLRPECWKWETVAEFYDDQLHTVYDWDFKDLQDAVAVQQDFEYRKYETGKLRADGEPGFDTPTGLVELRSSIYPLFGEEPLPYFIEPYYSPYSDRISDEIKEEYPLVVTTGGRNLLYFHSEHRQMPSLRKLYPDPIVTINPETGAKYGIQDGDWVAIENPEGRCVQRARLSIEVDPRVIHLEHGWWFPEEINNPSQGAPFRANPNNLIPHEIIGKLGYGANYKSVLAKIYKVNGPEE